MLILKWMTNLTYERKILIFCVSDSVNNRTNQMLHLPKCSNELYQDTAQPFKSFTIVCPPIGSAEIQEFKVGLRVHTNMFVNLTIRELTKGFQMPPSSQNIVEAFRYYLLTITEECNFEAPELFTASYAKNVNIISKKSTICLNVFVRNTPYDRLEMRVSVYFQGTTKSFLQCRRPAANIPFDFIYQTSRTILKSFREYMKVMYAVKTVKNKFNSLTNLCRPTNDISFFEKQQHALGLNTILPRSCGRVIFQWQFHHFSSCKFSSVENNCART